MLKHCIICLACMVALGAVGCIESTEGGNNNASLCGNGDIDPGEQCDDGNTIDHDGCSATCMVEGFCGNGEVEPGEECDDQNYTDGDGCDAQCQIEDGCGNGRLDVFEECDDDNLTDGDGCSALCVDEEPGALCGNGIHEVGEGCDDGNTASGDGCGPSCEREDGCGDGTVTDPEMCDDGNTVNGDGCSDVCRVEFVCGNDYCEEQNYETCYLCPADCCPDCGNGELDPGEECDDGNNDDDDGCDRACVDEDGQATCGNGIWEAGEECEDGNTTIHDGCSDTCLVEFVCGDQQCDDHVGETCQRCQVDCCPQCGNGVLEQLLDEVCDSNDFGGVTCGDFCYSGGVIQCTAWCEIDLSACTGTLPVCGNGVVECGEECDGTNLNGEDCNSQNHDGGTLGCSNCQFDYSQCGPLLCLPQNEAIKLYEVSHDGGPSSADYFALINLSVCPTDLLGLQTQSEDAGIDNFTLPSRVLQPNEVVYLVESSSGGANDINLGYSIGWVSNSDGYVLLCDGPCSTPANIIDAMQFGVGAPALPTGINFTPGTLPDVPTNTSYQRTAYNGVAPNFVAADWTTGTPTY